MTTPRAPAPAAPIVTPPPAVPKVAPTVEGTAVARRAPVTMTTLPKAITATLVNHEQKALTGALVLVVTQVNEDDSLSGTLAFVPDEAGRKWLALATGVVAAKLPPYALQQGVRATLPRNAACPVLRLDIEVQDFEMSGAKIHSNQTSLEIVETPAYLTQLFCNLARQRNVNRQRRGIIAAINRALSGEPVEEGEPQKN